MLVYMRTPTRIIALAVACAASLSLAGAASAQTRAQPPSITDITAVAGCTQVLPISATEAGCVWGTPGASWRDAAIITVFEPGGKPAWRYWDSFPSGTSVIGNGWAASVNGQGAASILVSRLGGRVR